MYAWKPGARVRTDASIAGMICEQMAKDGRLSAENLVEDSRPETAPLHGEFTWDDNVAAEQWRKQEARNIISHIEIQIETAPPVQAFVKLTQAEPIYRETNAVIKTVDGRKILLENAYRELLSFQRKYAALNELANVFAAINQISIEPLKAG